VAATNAPHTALRASGNPNRCTRPSAPRRETGAVGSAGPTVSTARVHCRPAGAGGVSPTRRHCGSPETSSRPGHARPPRRRRRDGSGRRFSHSALGLPTPHPGHEPGGGDSATGTGPPAGSRPSAIPEQLSAPCTDVAGLQALAGPRCPRGTLLVGGCHRGGLWTCAAHLLCARVRDRTSRRPGRTIRVRQVMASAGDAIVKGLAGTGAPCGCAAQREPEPSVRWTTRAFYKHQLV